MRFRWKLKELQDNAKPLRDQLREALIIDQIVLLRKYEDSLREIRAHHYRYFV